MRNRQPVGDNQWWLFDIVNDSGESNDLAQAMPERFKQMQVEYQKFAEENGVQPVLEGYNYFLQGIYNGLHDRGLLTLLIGVACALGSTSLAASIEGTEGRR